MHTDWSSLSLWFFSLWWDDFGSHLTKTHQSQQIRKLHKTNNIFFWWIVGLLESIFIYFICTQYFVGAPFALITASIRRGEFRWSVCGTAEMVWKPRFIWQWPSAHLHFVVSCFSFSSRQYPIDSLWDSGLVSFLAMVIQPTFSAFGSVGRCQILLENEISIFKKLVCRRKHEVLQNVLVNGCSDVGFQKNTMDQHQQKTLQTKSSKTVET